MIRWRLRIEGEPCKPVSRVLCPSSEGRMVTIYLARPLALGPWGSRANAGQRYRRGQAANPGTSRTPIVPLFGLAPGGVWPPLRHRIRPDALTVRFHPYPSIPGRTVCFCATFRPPQPFPSKPGLLRGPGGYPAPCQVEPGLSSPVAPNYQDTAAVTQPTWLSERTLAYR